MKLSKQELGLITKAMESTKKIKTNRKEKLGDVGCALISNNGNIFSGVSIVCDCGIGFCAEHSAIASMITNGETCIKTIAAASCKGAVLPPCGRCRELIYQIDGRNLDAEVIISNSKKVKLKELLPEVWQKKYYKK